MKNYSSKMSCALMVSTLVLLPGCWLKDKLGLNKQESAPIAEVKEGDVVLATMDGKPVLYASELDKQHKALVEMHPQFAQMEGLEQRILESLAGQKIITRWIEENGFDKTPEYKQQMEALVQMVNGRFFQMKHTPQVTEAEKKAYYEKNKENMPEAVLSRGGVPVVGVAFNKESDAKAFMEKAKGNGAAKGNGTYFEKLAKDAGFSDKFRDFKLVNANSYGIDPVLREKVIAIKKLPSVELIKVNDTNYYVVNVGNKEEPKYRSYEDVKGVIEQRLMGEKQNEALEKAVEKLKKDYNLQVNEEYLMKKNAPAQEVENAEQLEMVMPEAPAKAA